MSQSSDFTYDIAIVGGGIIGAAVFYELQKRDDSLAILLLEKENEVGKHQTGRNSGVIHSGIYYKPGSLKAKNCREGRRALINFAKEHNVAHDICGKVIVATKQQELNTLKNIFERGLENKTPDIQEINAEQIKEIEPFCTSSISGIRVGAAGIIDYVAFNQKLLELSVAKNSNNKYLFNQNVIQIENREHYAIVITDSKKFKAKTIINCTGLQADRMAKKNNVNQLDCKIVPFRGDYYDLVDHAAHKVKHLIYPVPDTDFPFLGVHFTRMIGGGIECGPNAVFSFKREGYSKTSFSFKDSTDALLYSGTWNLFAKHWKKGLEEYRRAFSKKRFLSTLQTLIPSLTMNEITSARSGVRAQALGKDGSLVDDFKIEFSKGSINVINAPSPAATACLSIAGHVADLYQKSS